MLSETVGLLSYFVSKTPVCGINDKKNSTCELSVFNFFSLDIPVMWNNANKIELKVSSTAAGRNHCVINQI